jgi:translocator protein
MQTYASGRPASSGPVPIVVAVVCLVVMGALGGLATEIGPWYASLLKPSWQPADWLFGPVWTTIYILIGIAAVRAWRRADAPAKNQLLWLWIINGLLNVVWSVLFFTMKRPDWALLEVVALWLSIAALIVVLARIDRLAAALLLPYLAWVSFAAYLNLTIAQLNRFI